MPTYSMYRIYMMAAGAQVIAVPAGADFSFPVDELCSRITPRTRMIAVANPNNPTGTIAAVKDLRRILAAAPDAAVLVDEAYFEFCGRSMLGASHRVSQPVCGANIFQGLRSGWIADWRADRRCRSNARGAASEFTLQRECGRVGLPARGRS